MKEFVAQFYGSLLALPGIALTVLCWGMYGPVLHKGQHHLQGGPPTLAGRLKPLICVGLAYFVVAIIIPTLVLYMNGKLSGDWNMRGIGWSLAAGSAGAFGALGIILALSQGGTPQFVMPLVFGGAPIVTVFMQIFLSRTLSVRDLGPVFYAGIIMVGVGAALVLAFQPREKSKHAAQPATHESTQAELKPTSKS